MKIIVNHTAKYGVLRFGDSFDNPSGNTLSLDIPYIWREVTISIIKTVLLVANNAIIAKRKNPTFPNFTDATSIKGASDAAIWSQGKTLTIAIATKRYIIVVIIDEYTIALGRFLCGFFTSSATLAISSKPI